jgi:predicted MFS family arabinose efflux permease
VTTSSERPGLRQAVVAFRYRNFRLFWIGALLSSTGTWVQWVTVPFVVFELTGSAAWVGFTGFVQFLPAVVVGPLAGSIADRFHRRTVLLVTQSLMAVNALVLWLIWTAGVRSVAAIVAVVAVGGVLGGLNIPSWQAFVSELVPREVLLNAVTLNSTQFNAARAFGPALGGVVLAAFGPGAAFLVNALSFVAVIVALLMIRVPRLARSTDRRGVLAQFVEALGYVRGRHGIAACFFVVLALGALGGPLFQLLAVFAERVFEVGDVAYGLLGAALGIGAVLAAPLIAGPGSGLARSRLTIGSTVVYGGAIVAFALAPAYALAFAALVVCGGAYLAIASTLNTTIQLQVDEAMRGKVLAAYIMCLTLAMPIGVLVQGALAEAIGARATVAGAGTLFVAVTAYLALGTDYVAAMDGEGAASVVAVVVEPAAVEPVALGAFGQEGLALEAALDEPAPTAGGPRAQDRLGPAVAQLGEAAGAVDGPPGG